MGRAPCCDKIGLRKGAWTPEEDQKLLAYIQSHGHGSWRALPKQAGLLRCGKSCRLRWTNYLRPDIKRGRFSLEEEQVISHLHAILGNRWSAIATHLPGRTDNEIKNYWNTHLKKRMNMQTGGIRDPAMSTTHSKTSTETLDLVLDSPDMKPLISSKLSHMSQWDSARLEAEGCQSLKSDEENSNSMSSFAGDVEGEVFDVENDETLDDSDEEVEDEYIKHSFNIAEDEADSQETQSDNSKVNSRQAVVSGIFRNSQSPDQEVKTSSVANFGRKFSKWRRVEEGMTIIVQVKKEAMGKKGPRLTAFPSLAGRFWVLVPRGKTVGVSSKITGPERRRLRLIAQDLQPLDFGITVRTEAMGHQREELEKDLTRLMDSWTEVMERAAAAAALVVDEGEEGAVPVLLHREMGQTLTTVRDFFTDKVQRLVVDSPQSYQEVMTYLQDVAPHLTSRVELYSGKVPIFDAFNIEAELEKFSNKRVKLPNGGYLVMEETEALVSIDVNGGVGMLGHSTRQREAILEVNLAAARQIALELRLRDTGGIIVVDFIDMDNVSDENLVYEEMRKAIQRDRSKVFISEISELGLMEMTRKRVRPSVTLTINEPCSSCKGTGYVEALETILGKIERAVRRLLADGPKQRQVMGSDKWPHILLRTDPTMFEYLRAWKWKRITQLSNALKVWLTLKVAMELTHGQFQVLEQPQFASEKHTSPESKFLHKAVSTNTLGKRVLPKRRRHSSK
ncbi:unnamed protein product [Sphagnum troendelagicum]